MTECVILVSATFFFLQKFFDDVLHTEFDQCDIPYEAEDKRGYQYIYLCKWSTVPTLMATVSFVTRFVLTLDELVNESGQDDPENKLALTER